MNITRSLLGDIQSIDVEATDLGSTADNLTLANSIATYLNGVTLDKDITGGTYDRTTGQLTLNRSNSCLLYTSPSPRDS